MPPRPRDRNARVDRDLETICLKCLSKEPKDRYPSARELADDLNRWLDGRPIVARPASRVERAVKWVRRRKLVAALSGAVVIGAILGVAGPGVGMVGGRRGAGRGRAGRGRRPAPGLRRRRSTWPSATGATPTSRRSCATSTETRPPAGKSDLRGFEWYYLDRLCHAQERVLAGQGRHLVAWPTAPTAGCWPPASWDQTITLWDAATGQAIRTLVAETRPSASSPSTRTARPWPRAGTTPSVTLWDVATGQVIRTLRGIPGRSCAWPTPRTARSSPPPARDGQGPALGPGRRHAPPHHRRSHPPTSPSAGDGKTLFAARRGKPEIRDLGRRHRRRWSGRSSNDDGTGADRSRSPSHADGKVAGLRHARRDHPPAGRRHGPASSTPCAITATRSRRFTWRSRPTARCWRPPACLNQAVTHLGCRHRPPGADAPGAYRHDPGHRLQPRRRPPGLRQQRRDRPDLGRDARPGVPLAVEKETRSTASPSAPTARILAAAGGDGTVTLRDLATGQVVRTFAGHTAAVRLTVAISPRRPPRGLRGRGPDGPDLGRRHRQGDPHPQGARATPSGRSPSARTARPWPRRATTGPSSSGTPRPAGRSGPSAATSSAVNAVAFTPDGKTLVSAGVDGFILPWDVESGRRRSAIHGPLPTASPRSRSARTGGGSPPGATIGPIKIWDLATGREVHTLRGHSASVDRRWRSPPTAGGWSRRASDRTVRVWDPSSGQGVLVLRGHTGPHLRRGLLPGWHADRLRQRRPDGQALGGRDRPRARRGPGGPLRSCERLGSKIPECGSGRRVPGPSTVPSIRNPESAFRNRFDHEFRAKDPGHGRRPPRASPSPRLRGPMGPDARRSGGSSLRRSTEVPCLCFQADVLAGCVLRLRARAIRRALLVVRVAGLAASHLARRHEGPGPAADPSGRGRRSTDDGGGHGRQSHDQAPRCVEGNDRARAAAGPAGAGAWTTAIARTTIASGRRSRGPRR